LLSSFVLAAVWVAKDQFSDKPSAWIASALGTLRTHGTRSALSISAFLAACVILWLLADRKEALEKIIETGLVFVPSKKLRPDHLSLVAFNRRYVEHAEVADAQQKLSTQQLLLILGRPLGGKTRLAFNLAKQSKRHWILRVPPGFLDWKSLNFPRIPHRCKVLWIVDDVDKFLGKSDIPQGERVLGAKCDLKLIVTCRAGHELEQARSDKELAAFLERLPAVTCSDFAQAELVSLAQQVGKSKGPGLHDHTPGSVLLGLAEMRKRLDVAGPEAQAVMKAMFLLRTALIFSPKKKLVTAVVTDIYRLRSTEDKIQAAMAALVLDGLLRQGQSLAPCHDCYLTTNFFPYYPAHGLHLEQDLGSLGDLLQQHGTPRDFQSLGVYWNSRKNYDRALPYLRMAAAANLRGPVLALHMSVALFYALRFDEALRATRQVLDVEPDNSAACFNLGVILGRLGRSEEAIQAHDEALRRFSDATAPTLREWVASALLNKGATLGELGRGEEAIKAYDEVLRRFGDASESASRERVAKALFSKGFTLAQLNRGEEAIQVYDEVLRRFGGATELVLRERVAKTLLNKGTTLGELGRGEEEIQVYDEVLRRFGDATESALRERAAHALFSKGVTLGQLNRSKEEIQAYDEVLRRFGDASEPALRERVANALFNKGATLGELNRGEEEIQAYDEVLRRFGDATEPVVRERVAQALLSKGVTLGQLNRGEEEIQTYDEVLRRFGDATEPVLREQVATALVNKGVALGQLNRGEEEIQTYDEVLRRFGDATEPAVREQVATALVNKGVVLGQLNRGEEEIQAYDEVLRRFGDATEPAVREQVATALVNKGVALGQLNRGEEEIRTYDEVLRRFGDVTEPVVREQVANALFNKGVTLNTLKRPEEARSSFREVLRRFADSPDAALHELVETAEAELKSLDTSETNP
jgi:tetratricopeptide (TPR) repeat protein